MNKQERQKIRGRLLGRRLPYTYRQVKYQRTTGDDNCRECSASYVQPFGMNIKTLCLVINRVVGKCGTCAMFLKAVATNQPLIEELSGEDELTAAEKYFRSRCRGGAI